MKVGIITLHASENFGSVIQALALQSYLRELGHETCVINYIYTNDYKQYRLFNIVSGYVLKSFVNNVLYLSRKVRRKKSFNKFIKQYICLTRKRFYDQDDLSELNDEFDAFICGSDQIWNPNCLKRIVPVYFLDFVRSDKKKIAYAPSMPVDPGKQYYEQIRNLVDGLDYISVREKSSIDVLKQCIGVRREIIDVCDPTLLMPGDFYINRFNLKSDNETKFNTEFIFVYILGDIGASYDLIKEAIDVQKNTGLPIYYVSNRAIRGFWGRQNRFLLGIGPEEFLKYIYHARKIVTDSFHATVFSVLFEKDFVSFGRRESESRVRDLLRYLDLQECYRDNNISIRTAEEIQYDKVNRRLDEMRKAGEKYLKEALKQEDVKKEMYIQ